MPGTQDMVLASKAKELYSAVMKAYRVCGEMRRLWQNISAY